MAYKTEELEFYVDATVHVDSTKTFTTVAVTLNQGATEWIGIGTAKRARGDKYNEDLGITLATARAFRDVAEDLERAASAL